MIYPIPLSMRKPIHNKNIKITFRPFSELNLIKLINYVTNFDWNALQSENVDFFMLKFIEKLDFFYCKSFPVKIKHISRKTYENPWITNDILKLIRYKSLLFSLNKKGIILTKDFNMFKNKLQRTIGESKILYFDSAFHRSRNNIKKTWKLIKGLTGSNLDVKKYC